MFHQTTLLAALALAATSAPVLAQIAPGESVEFSIGTGATGIDIIDAAGSGALTAITGFLPTSREANTGVIDPVTGDVWVVGLTNPATAVVHRYSITGSVVTTETAVVAGITGSFDLSAIALDQDGNPFVCNKAGIWKINRHSFAVTNWAGLSPVGSRNAMTIDRATNTLWTGSFNGISSQGSEIREFDLNAGPSNGTQIFDAVAGGMPSRASGLTHDRNGTLYVGCWDGLYGFDTNTGIATLVPVNAVMNPVLGISNEFNNIDYDSIHGTLHTAGGVVGDAAYHAIDPISGASTLLNTDHYCTIDFTTGEFCFTADVMTGVSVNDYLHTTQVFPRQASASTGFRLEIAAQGMPGDFAAIAVVELNGIALGSPLVLGGYGTCGLGGNFVYTSNIPSGSVPGFVTSIGIDTVTYDFGLGVFTNGGMETILINP